MRRRLVVGGVIAAGAFSGAAQAPKVLRYVPEFDLRVLDPIVDTGLTTLQHGYMVYDTLFAMDAWLHPRPQMIEDYGSSADGLLWEFVLRHGLLFHDGSAVRAADCVASVRRWAMRDAMGRVLQERVRSLDAVDARTFRVRLRRPFPLLPNALGKISASPCFIMRENDAESDPYQPVMTAVGSGPFRFLADEHVPGVRAAYERNSAYQPREELADGYAGGKRVMVDRVQWHFLPDMATRVAALSRGEVDVVASLPFDLLPVVQRRADLRIEVLDRLGWMMYIRPNQLHPPFDDVRARRALACLVDQSDYLALAGDVGRFTHVDWSVLGAGLASAEEFGLGPVPDLKRARALLQEAGYRGEPIVVLDPVDNALLSGANAVTVARLREIGVLVLTIAGDLATINARRASKAAPNAGGWHLFHGRSLSAELANPLTNFPLASPSGAARPAGWYGWPDDPALESLRQSWADATGPGERAALAERLQIEAARSVPFVPLGRVNLPMAHRASVTGLLPMPVIVFWGVDVATT